MHIQSPVTHMYSEKRLWPPCMQRYRAECGAVEMCPSLLQGKLDQGRHRKPCCGVAAHLFSLFMTLSMSPTTVEDDTLPRIWPHVQTLLARGVRLSF